MSKNPKSNFHYLRQSKSALCACGFFTLLCLANSANAQTAPEIPEWKPTQANPAIPSNTAPTAQTSGPAIIIDQSDELIAIDKGFAENISANGPLLGYGAYISDQGMLYDAAGGSPEGQGAVQARFATFPKAIIMERRPEKAMASGGAGASWGAYSVKRGDSVLSDGRYVTIWRKEASGWKIVSELAAGRTNAPPPLPIKPISPATQSAPLATGVGAMPVMRDALGRPIKAPSAPTSPN